MNGGKNNSKKYLMLEQDTREYSLSDISNKYLENVKELSESIGLITKGIASQITELRKQVSPLIEGIVYQFNKYTPYFKELADSLEKARKNPESLINWYNYFEQLSKYLWTIPYDIDAKTLKEVFENVNSEKDFDAFMLKYFTKEKLNKLFLAIEEIIPSKHKTMFKQIKKAFDEKLYSLSMAGIMSIIDELCSYFLLDKGCSKRQNMFKPIIEKLSRDDEQIYDCLSLMMLEKNINVIYENIDFNEKIKVDTHKKARRNPIQHGRSFSNRKVDAIMLFNTILNLLIAQNNLKQYKGKLYKKNGAFYIPSTKEQKEIKEKIKVKQMAKENKKS